MRVVIVGRDRDVIEPLIDKLARENFEVVVVENSAGVQSCLKRGSLQFLVAEVSLLVDRGLGREVLKRCPLARLIGLTAHPSILGMVDALSSGLTDYFPRSSEYFDDVVEAVSHERDRLIRWQRILLSGAEMASADPAAPEPAEEAFESEMLDA